jgi:myo-inositol-1(or 4)-monophosphatase
VGNDNNKVYVEIASSAARDAGRLLLENFSNKREIGYKGRIDLVTEMDTLCEKMIVGKIRESFPEHGILAEEGTGRESDSEYLWYIDPLDGTTNYAHGFGFFAVSIGLEKKGYGIIAAAVYAPYFNEFYSASKGGGAYLNGMKIGVSSTDSLEKSLLATGFPYDIKETRGNIDNFNRFILCSQAVRRPGSAAIDLCSVAAGKFDGFWEIKLHPWDTAAASLIVEEAGGIITDFNSGNFSPYKEEVLASNGLIHEDMIRVLNYERES